MGRGQMPGHIRETSTKLHASCVAHAGSCVLITGVSGSGKSGLALQLMALGAQLVADDRTCLTSTDGQVLASAPARLKGLIEARQVGLLRSAAADPTPVALVVDMNELETERLPPERQTRLLGVSLPLIRKSELAHFPAAILTYLSGGRDA